MATPSVFTVPPVYKRRGIPMRTIRAIAKHIAEKFNPEKIILFGSYAYGKPTAWSDVDLLVVMDTPKGEVETSLEIYKSLPTINFGLDIVVRSHEVIERRKS
ncbi:MAG: nucleotidyltransferase domain-containing protein [Anaerolineae bacterium]|nr:nucleotidyltransferase domain-containing protein [Anaerolineae bacterium]MCI0609874.1 nucleotidyltransferase domain-containing protein [Anaerolineae bacterium]